MTRRIFDQKQFDTVYENSICKGVFNEEPKYYPRYKSRYKALLDQYSRLAASSPLSILDVGGGQLGLLCKELWQDEAYVVDIGGPHLNYLESQGIQVAKWNLCAEEPPFTEKFDFIFFSEVIEHLPIPGHIVLEKLRKTLKPGGTIICSTPNLYRLRNVVYMIFGKEIYDYFYMPEDRGLGHVLEYSRSHLYWQFERAGFKDCTIEYHQMHHLPNNLIFRLMYVFGSPLFLIPRFCDNLVAIAQSP